MMAGDLVAFLSRELVRTRTGIGQADGSNLRYPDFGAEEQAIRHAGPAFGAVPES